MVGGALGWLKDDSRQWWRDATALGLGLHCLTGTLGLVMASCEPLHRGHKSSLIVPSVVNKFYFIFMDIMT